MLNHTAVALAPTLGHVPRRAADLGRRQDRPAVPPPFARPTTAAPLHSPLPRLIRSLFVSDVHLGCKHSQAADLVELLERVEPQNLYLVGDFVDGWKLKRRWRWAPEYDRLIQRILELKRGGTRVFYTPGNHDEFLRPFVANFGVVDVRDRFVHRAADGRRFLVLHGDQFDRVEQNHQWLSLVASYAYDAMLTANWWANRLRGKKHDPYAFCGALKRRVKRLVSHVSEFESLVVEAAHAERCEGVICGHVHAPRIVQLDGIAYLNTGDWVENCTALVEKEDGAFELIRRDGRLIDRLPARVEAPRPVAEREPAAAV